MTQNLKIFEKCHYVLCFSMLNYKKWNSTYYVDGNNLKIEFIFNYVTILSGVYIGKLRLYKWNRLKVYLLEQRQNSENINANVLDNSLLQ